MNTTATAQTVAQYWAEDCTDCGHQRAAHQVTGCSPKGRACPCGAFVPPAEDDEE